MAAEEEMVEQPRQKDARNHITVKNFLRRINTFPFCESDQDLDCRKVGSINGKLLASAVN